MIKYKLNSNGHTYLRSKLQDKISSFVDVDYVINRLLYLNGENLRPLEPLEISREFTKNFIPVFIVLESKYLDIIEEESHGR